MTLDQKHLYYDNYNANFYKYGKDLLKIFKNYVSEELENQIIINRLIHDDVDRRIILPKGLIYDEKKWLLGYRMDFVNGINLSKEIKQNNLTYEDKVFLINELFALLKEIHTYLVVGDVRNSNIMIGKDKRAYLIDFDYSQKLSSSKRPYCMYHVYNGVDPLNDQNEDIIKMYISTLSLLYNFDVEREFSKSEDVEYLSCLIPFSGLLKEYYHYMIDCVYKHQKIGDYLELPFSSSLEKEINTAKSRILAK